MYNLILVTDIYKYHKVEQHKAQTITTKRAKYITKYNYQYKICVTQDFEIYNIHFIAV